MAIAATSTNTTDNVLEEASGEPATEEAPEVPVTDDASGADMSKKDSAEQQQINEIWLHKKSNCPNAFLCRNGRCVPGYYRCDKFNDCIDGSDEKGCDRVVCAENEFRCRSGMCIPSWQRCDIVPDCPDKDDELDC